MFVKVKKVNGFTDSINGGNPAGVVFDSPDLTDEQMAYITKTIAASETAFVFPSKRADYKVRFFTSEFEVDLCGHGTIATFFTMGLEKMITKNSIITQETKAGILPVEILFSGNDVKKVMMTQGKPIFKDIYLDILKLADSLNISHDEIDDSLPNQLVSTGLFTLPICIKSFDVLKNIKPNFDKIKTICNELNAGSFHVFTFETLESNSVFHARNFAPVYAVNEDPTTGTANGAVCSYLLKNKIIKENNLICEQGDIIGRPGRVFVEIDNDTVRVGGRAKVIEELNISV
jgi:PhzF family phenazine biosynthesis protein